MPMLAPPWALVLLVGRQRLGLQECVIRQLRVSLTGGERPFTNPTRCLGRTDNPVTFLEFWARKGTAMDQDIIAISAWTSAPT